MVRRKGPFATPAPWFVTVQDTEILLPTFPVSGPEMEETIRSGRGGASPAPLNWTFVGLV